MSLVIRNFTNTALSLKRIERYESATSASTTEEKGSALYGICNIFKALIGLLHSSSDLALQGDLSEHAKSLEHQDVETQIKAFSASQIRVEPPDCNTLRLIFESDGGRYRIDTPTNESRSTALTPMADDSNQEYTALYSKQHQQLTIFSSTNMSKWMSDFIDETPVTGLSIPGTHNSPTWHRALPSVRCQAVSPIDQLNNGVRFFDIRVQVENPKDLSKDGLVLVHSVFPISLTGTKYFRDLLIEVHDFLERNPSESVIISLKREGTGDGTDHQLAQVLHKHYTNDARRWYTEPRLPRLGDVRGKLVLLRRFGIDDDLRKEHNGKGWGINGETWADNTPHALSPNGELCVQDFYEVMDNENIDNKIKYSTEQLARAAATFAPRPGIQQSDQTKQQPLYINFLSASNFWRVDCWPERIAAKLNPAVVDYLCRVHADGKQPGDGATGIVVCDWVGNGGDWDLVRAIVGMNAKLLLRQRD